MSGAEFRTWCALSTWRATTADEADLRGQRLVAASSWAAAAVAYGFTVAGLASDQGIRVTLASLATGVAFSVVPSLRRVAVLAPVLGFLVAATAAISTLTALLGTSSGLLFYFFIMMAATPLVAGLRRWPVAVLSAVIATTAVVVLQFSVPNETGASPHWLMSGAFIANSVAAGAMAIGIVGYGLFQIQRVEAALAEEHRRSEALLDNILPRTISDRLKVPDRADIADAYDEASVLFADIAGFTAMSSGAAPADVVRFLDRLYSALDHLIEQHGLEKIKTTGDSYMVVSGVPLPRPDHAEALAAFALEMREEAGRIIGTDGRALVLRIGMAMGPVVAGVIGSKKFFYDVWGDAVNMASRMESTGVAGRIQVSESVRTALDNAFVFEERGTIEVKGKGNQRTWFLIGPSVPQSAGI